MDNKNKGVVETNATDSHEIYRVVFRDYPDVLDVKQVSTMLGVSTKMVYKLLRDGSLDYLKIGREYRIPKVNLMKYIKIFGSTNLLSAL